MRSTKKEWEVYKYVQKKVEVTDGIALIRNVPKGVSPTKVAKFCLGVSGKNIGMGIRYKKKFADLGVRKRSDFPLDINQVLRTIAPRYGGTGGGHPNAGGARVLRESLDEFLTALSKEVSAII
jgi:RecJ-like exonuclease